MVREAALMGVLTKGGFSFETIRDLPWSDYVVLVEEVPKVIAEAYKEDSGAS